MKISARFVFSVIFLFTVFITRLWVFLLPNTSSIVLNLPVHHFWVGLSMVILGLLLSYKMKVPIVAFGLGLVIDESAFVLLGDGGYAGYWSSLSIAGAIVFSAIVFLLVPKIIIFLKK